MSDRIDNISLTRPVNEAIERTKIILFKPFKLDKWFVIGFSAWLATLLKGGFNFRWAGGGDGGVLSGEWLREHTWLVMGISIVSLMVVALWLLLLWLSSRGSFMFLHCVAQNKAEVKTPWRRWKACGNSLMWFRLLVAVVILAIGILTMAAVFGVVTAVRGCNNTTAITTGAVLFGVTVFIVIAAAVGVISKLTGDFVVPIMYMRSCNWRAGWREFFPLLKDNAGKFALYILFQIIINMCVGMIILAAICFTCCCAGCVIMIPYIGAVALLPITVFLRLYSLCYLRQYGPSFDAFAPV